MAKGGFRGGMPMGGMNQMQMMKQAQKMQQDLLKMQQEMETKEYEATAGGGVVTAVANGKRELLRITIDPEAVDPDDVEGMANAMKKVLADEHLRREMIEKGKEYVVRFDPKTLADEMNAVYLKCFDDKTFTEDRFVQTSSNKRTKISHYLPFF